MMNQNQISYDWLSHTINQTLLETSGSEIEEAMLRLIKFKFRSAATLSKDEKRMMDQDFSRLLNRACEGQTLGTAAGMLASLYLHLDGRQAMQYAQYLLREEGMRIGEELPDFNSGNVRTYYSVCNRALTAVNIAEQLGVKAEETVIWLKEVLRGAQAVPGYASDEDEETVEQILTELQGLIGLDAVKQEVGELIQWIAFNALRKEAGFKVSPVTLHTVYSGSPGTGKTTVARIIGRLLKAMGILKKGHMVEVSRQDLVAEYIGQTAVKTQKKIDEAMGGVLFIDEAYALARGHEIDFGREAIDTLVKALEDHRDKFVVILAGYPEEMKGLIEMNPGLESRFTRYFTFEDYDALELVMIAEKMLADHQFTLDSQAKQTLIRFLSTQQGNGNGRLVRNVVEAMIIQKAVHTVQEGEKDLQLISDDMIERATRLWKTI